jgi:hypothetical protein
VAFRTVWFVHSVRQRDGILRPALWAAAPASRTRSFLASGLGMARHCVVITEVTEQGETIADARRARDADKSMEMIEETMKLIGNSLYGRCIMNKEHHIGMTYANENNIAKRINDPHFKDLNNFSEISFEAHISNRYIQ